MDVGELTARLVAQRGGQGVEREDEACAGGDVGAVARSHPRQRRAAAEPRGEQDGAAEEQREPQDAAPDRRQRVPVVVRRARRDVACVAREPDGRAERRDDPRGGSRAERAAVGHAGTVPSRGCTTPSPS